MDRTLFLNASQMECGPESWFLSAFWSSTTHCISVESADPTCWALGCDATKVLLQYNKLSRFLINVFALFKLVMSYLIIHAINFPLISH
jgi:hypothetical protein